MYFWLKDFKIRISETKITLYPHAVAEMKAKKKLVQRIANTAFREFGYIIDLFEYNCYGLYKRKILAPFRKGSINIRKILCGNQGAKNVVTVNNCHLCYWKEKNQKVCLSANFHPAKSGKIIALSNKNEKVEIYRIEDNRKIYLRAKKKLIGLALPFGDYIIKFKKIDGFISPSPQKISLSECQHTSIIIGYYQKKNEEVKKYADGLLYYNKGKVITENDIDLKLLRAGSLIEVLTKQRFIATKKFYDKYVDLVAQRNTGVFPKLIDIPPYDKDGRLRLIDYGGEKMFIIFLPPKLIVIDKGRLYLDPGKIPTPGYVNKTNLYLVNKEFAKKAFVTGKVFTVKELIPRVWHIEFEEKLPIFRNLDYFIVQGLRYGTGQALLGAIKIRIVAKPINNYKISFESNTPIKQGDAIWLPIPCRAGNIDVKNLKRKFIYHEENKRLPFSLKFQGPRSKQKKLERYRAIRVTVKSARASKFIVEFTEPFVPGREGEWMRKYALPFHFKVRVYKPKP